MKCGKQCFYTKSKALKAMRKVPVKPDGTMPMQVYRCGTCKAWHFTSNAPYRRKA